MALAAVANDIEQVSDLTVYGRVAAVVGLSVEVEGLHRHVCVGDHCSLISRDGRKIPAEVVGARDRLVLAMPFGDLDGVGLGTTVAVGCGAPSVAPGSGWLGRIVDGFGRACDGRGPLPKGLRRRTVRAHPPSAHDRQRVEGKIDLGVRALNAFVTCCRGQRLGIFAGSGVGKSTLLSMIARHSSADVNVIALVGERGREAREFIEDDLGAEGLARSVVVVATSDQPPLVRRQAAHTAMTIAESFRADGKDVLLLMDSVTRFATAQREIGLSVGEPPTTRGYTPSVFAELPRLLERAGPGRLGEGSMTGLFTVLVEGDDHNEPVADAVRSILDGHIVLDRAIAERGRYPAVNVVRSVSRTLPACNDARENGLIQRARRLLATYEDMAELIRLGAYRAGSDADVDEAIRFYPALESYLSQTKAETVDLAATYQGLEEILGAPDAVGASANGPNPVGAP